MEGESCSAGTVAGPGRFPTGRYDRKRNATAAAAMLPSLVGHLMYGSILGLMYAWLSRHDVAPAFAAAD